VGWDSRSVEVVARIDNHGDERREEDLALWQELRKKIEAIAAEEKYERIQVRVY
jgi:hypothetical protein